MYVALAGFLIVVVLQRVTFNGKILGVPYVVLEQIDDHFFVSRFGNGTDLTGGMWKVQRGAFEPETSWSEGAVGEAAITNLSKSQVFPKIANFSFDERASNALMVMEVSNQMDSIICSVVNNMFLTLRDGFWSIIAYDFERAFGGSLMMQCAASSGLSCDHSYCAPSKTPLYRANVAKLIDPSSYFRAGLISDVRLMDRQAAGLREFPSLEVDSIVLFLKERIGAIEKWLNQTG